MPNKYQSTKYRKKALENADKLSQPPDFVDFNDEEMSIWRGIMRCRPYSSWSDADLLTVVKIVRQEMVIRRGYKKLETWEDDGADRLDSESVASEYAANLEKAIKLQLTALRSIGVTRTSMQVKNAHKHVEEGEEAANAAKGFDIGGGTLLAVN